MEPKYSLEGGVNFTKYKDLARENLDFWALCFKLGYDVVNRMHIDELLEAREALSIINKSKTE